MKALEYVVVHAPPDVCTTKQVEVSIAHPFESVTVMKSLIWSAAGDCLLLVPVFCQ
jgi:hypothetical protein